MAINKIKYDGVHYQVVLMNMSDGSVQGHGLGCADLTRKTDKFAEPYQADDAWDVETKADGWFAYNSDFLAEGGIENAYEINWLPCTNHIPEGNKQEAFDAAFGETEEAEVVEEGVVAKVGRKWTYLYLNGELIAEVLNEQATAVMAYLQTSR